MKLKNPKAKGSRNERRMRDWLEARGYSVTKAGGSLGCWDLIGHGKVDRVWPERLILVQVKSTRGCSPAERQQMIFYIRDHGSDAADWAVIYLIARWKPYAEEPSVFRFNPQNDRFDPWENEVL